MAQKTLLQLILEIDPDYQRKAAHQLAYEFEEVTTKGKKEPRRFYTDNKPGQAYSWKT